MSTQLRAQVDKLLTQASAGYFPDGYVSEEALPEIQVVQTSGLLGKYGNNHLRIENSVKAGKGKYRRVETIARSTQTYVIEGHGLEGLITDEDYRNVENPFDAEKDEVTGISGMLWLEKEKTLADTLTDNTILTQYKDISGNKFDDYANSDPINEFNLGKIAIRNGCGAVADTMICEYSVAEKLRYHPQLLDALGYKWDRPGGLNYEELRSAMGLKRILVPNVVYNSAKEGQTDSLAPVWGKHIILAVLPESAAVRQVSLGYLVRYSNKAPRQVYKWPKRNPPNATAILVEDHYDMLISNASAGYLMQNVIS
jgi:hypothetical protein